jgi:hypothetical protein
VARNFDQSVEYFNALAHWLKGFGVGRVILAGPTPHWSDDLPSIIMSHFWAHTPRRTYTGVRRDVLSINTKLKAAFLHADGVAYADVIGVFCNKEGCLTYLGDDRKGGIVSWDTGHLTPIASDYLAKNLLVDLVTGAN